MFKAILTVCLFGGAFAQVPALGGCPDVETVENFDLTKYLGKWYEAERYFAIFEVAGKCVSADYSPGENGTIRVVNSQISTITGKSSMIEGSARVPDPKSPAKLKVTFSPVPFGIEGNYWVLGTDYQSFSVVYSCTNLQIVNFKYAWILTRDRNPPQSVIDKAVEVVNKNNITRSSFSKTDQTNCST